MGLAAIDKIALIVPVYKNFEGFTRLMASVDTQVTPIIIPNYEENIGVSAGWNAGIRRAQEARCDLVLICNDDVVLNPGTIDKLRQCMYAADLVSAINTRDHATQPLGWLSDSPDFSCFMGWTEDYLPTGRFGEFDENFTPAYFEDNDMAYRIKLRGGSAKCAIDAGMYHAGSVTQNWGGQQVVTSPMFEKNRAYYYSKWGGFPGTETFLEPFGGTNE